MHPSRLWKQARLAVENMILINNTIYVYTVLFIIFYLCSSFKQIEWSISQHRVKWRKVRALSVFPWLGQSFKTCWHIDLADRLPLTVFKVYLLFTQFYWSRIQSKYEAWRRNSHNFLFSRFLIIFSIQQYSLIVKKIATWTMEIF